MIGKFYLDDKQNKNQNQKALDTNVLSLANGFWIFTFRFPFKEKPTHFHTADAQHNKQNAVMTALGMIHRAYNLV